MSTNFYLRGRAMDNSPDGHIGKRRSAADFGCSFSWAIEPGELRAKIAANVTCHACGRQWGGADASKVIEDEYGDLYTIAEFEEGVLAGCRTQKRNMIGKEFC